MPKPESQGWSEMMANVNPCGHTNAQHLYHDSGDLRLEPCPRLKDAASQHEPTPSCTVCGTPMKSVYKCPKCGSTPACSEPSPALTAEQFWKKAKPVYVLDQQHYEQDQDIYVPQVMADYTDHVTAALRAERDQLQLILEQERTQLCDGVNAIKHELDSRDWLTEGRGPYEWDDDRWHKEFAYAGRDISKALEPLEKIAADLKNCPKTHKEVVEARTNWKQRAEQAEQDLSSLTEELITLYKESTHHVQTIKTAREIIAAFRQERDRLREALTTLLRLRDSYARQINRLEKRTGADCYIEHMTLDEWMQSYQSIMGTSAALAQGGENKPTDPSGT